ncbi:T9SS type A sorting domain-containing protein [Imperialibacter roseus]|uniref:T9SS type A sorting domain-containing protein n=1 Tax=Imperialibacter roseus TaxID=1324217 RepID=A0ABZ0IZR0_9BACT|nr:T9SS type A sorting domain-containing protein [Imperialibacter roseus]WOK09172.1 T9SS type A sorting domain-containing protein [Imperialibacter roseus]
MMKSGVLGVEDEIALSIYPNPAQDHINIAGMGQMTVRLLSLSGDVVSNTAFIDQITIDLGSLPQAMYLLEITNNSQQRTVRRIVKSN